LQLPWHWQRGQLKTIYSLLFKRDHAENTARIIPFAAVVSTGALTARLAYVEYQANWSIPTLNTLAQNDVILERPKYGIVGYDLVYFNSSKDPGGLLYLDTIGPRLIILDWFKRARPVASPCKGYNCTLNVIFEAPWYECQEKSVDKARKALDTMDWVDIENSDWAPRAPVTLYVVSGGQERLKQYAGLFRGRANHKSRVRCRHEHPRGGRIQRLEQW